MRLSVTDFALIQNAVSELQGMKTVTVRQIFVAGHTIFLDRASPAGHDDPVYVIVGITNKSLPDNADPYR